MPRGSDVAHLETLARCPLDAAKRKKKAAPRAPNLPWPRTAEDGTALGVDLAARHGEVRKLMAKEGYHVPGHEFEDLVAETCLVIARRNRMPCAFDPRKASFGHYVHLVARHTCANLSQARTRQVEVLGASECEVEAERDPRVAQFERLNRGERERLGRELRAAGRALPL